MLSLDKIELLFNHLLEEGEVKVFQMEELCPKKYYTLGDRAWNHLFGTDKHHIEAVIIIRVDWFVNGNHYVQAIAPDSLPYDLEGTVEIIKKYAEQFKKARRIKEDFS